VSVQFQTEPEAALELEEAADWYEQRRFGLGDEFLAAIDEAIAFIARWPEAGSPVPDVSEDLPIRRTPVRRFPYQVVYLEMHGVIRILAFAHDRRSPGYWHSRTAQ
jgi:plasmid stabilization system protein ParE